MFFSKKVKPASFILFFTPSKNHPTPPLATKAAWSHKDHAPIENLNRMEQGLWEWKP